MLCEEPEDRAVRPHAKVRRPTASTRINLQHLTVIFQSTTNIQLPLKDVGTWQ